MEIYNVITIIEREKGDELIKMYKNAGLKNIMSTLGRGTSSAKELTFYDKQKTEKVIVNAFANKEQTHQLIEEATNKLYIDIPGHGLLVAVPVKSVSNKNALSVLTEEKLTGGKPKMEFAYELVVVIINEGHGDQVMKAARKAGAVGGTIFHAKGTGSREKDKFINLSIAHEKDIIYIVAKATQKTEIMKQINEECGLQTEVEAVSFSMPVSEVAGLRVK